MDVTFLHIEKTGGTAFKRTHGIAVTGKPHRRWCELPRHDNVATILRDPVERAISHYWHAVTRWRNGTAVDWIRQNKPGIVEFFTACPHPAARWNLQTWRLGDSLHEAIQNLQRCVLVLTTEKLTIARHNVSPPTPEVSIAERLRVKQEHSSDFALYAEAQRLA